MHRLRSLTAFAALVLLWFAPSPVRSQDTPLTGDVWTAPMAPLTARGLSDVTQKGSDYWAVGEGGVFKSTNLSTWTKVTTTGLTDYLTGIRWNGSNFVATGIGLWTSPDGAAWTLRSSFYPFLTISIAVRGNITVAVGVLGNIARSADGGVTWTRQNSGTQVTLAGVAANAARFIAVGENGTILNSPDGITWTARTSTTSAFLSDVAIVGTRAVAVGDDATILVSSSNGDTWTGSAIPGATGFDLRSVAGDSSSTVMCGPAGRLLFCTDPANFATIQIITVEQCQATLQCVAHSNSGGWACVGAGGTILTSTSGTTWTLRAPQASYNFTSTARTSSHFLTAGWPGDKVGRSTDGVAWTFTSSNQTAGDVQPITALVWAPSPAKLVAATAGGRILSSTASDGTGLALRTSGTSRRINGGCWTGSQFIMVGEANPQAGTPAIILTSTNGNTWVGRASGTSASLFGAASNGTRHVVCGGSLNPQDFYGILLTSTDGVGWTPIAYPDWPVVSVAWNGSLFVTVGVNGLVATSPDGLEWTRRGVDGETGPWEGILASVVWAGTNWVAVGEGGDVALSTDGLTWKARRYAGSATLSSVTYGVSKAIAAGEAGQILGSVSALGTLPVIKIPPLSQTLTTDGAAGVVAEGTPTLRYQWRKDGVELPGETRLAVGISFNSALNSGIYDVIVTNDFGSVISVAATIRVPASPVFTEQPQGEQFVTEGESLTLTATAGGAGPITYQWFKSGTGLLPGKTSASLTLTSANAQSAGTYYLEASNEYGTSSTTTIPVVLAPALINGLDLPAGTVVTTSASGFAAVWRGTAVSHHDGTDAAVSGLTPHGGQSWMEMTVSGVSSVSFWWNVSSEACCDFVRFRVDGQIQDSLSGTGNWTQRTFSVPVTGSHILSWDYSKDGSEIRGEDKAWVDQVTFTASPDADFPLWAAAENLPAARRGVHDSNGPLLLDNTLAYALGVAPLTATPSMLPSFTRGGNTLTFRYTRGRRVPGVIYRVEWSTDPAASVWSASGVNESLTSSTVAQETWTAQLVPPPGTPRLYMRLRVSLSPL